MTTYLSNMANEIAESFTEGLIVGFTVTLHLQYLDKKTGQLIKVENVWQTEGLRLALNISLVWFPLSRGAELTSNLTLSFDLVQKGTPNPSKLLSSSLSFAAMCSTCKLFDTFNRTKHACARQRSLQTDHRGLSLPLTGPN